MSKDFYSSDSQKNARLNGDYTKIMGNLTKCPFCDLKEKYIIKSLEHMVLTVNLFPYVDGHLLIIPKRHIQTFSELNPEEWNDVKELTSLGSQKLLENLNVKSFNLLYREGTKSGSSLGHLHLHILPMEQVALEPKWLPVTLAPIDLAEKLK